MVQAKEKTERVRASQRYFSIRNHVSRVCQAPVLGLARLCPCPLWWRPLSPAASASGVRPRLLSSGGRWTSWATWRRSRPRFTTRSGQQETSVTTLHCTWCSEQFAVLHQPLESGGKEGARPHSDHVPGAHGRCCHWPAAQGEAHH